MPINVFGKSSSWYDNGNIIDTSLFVQKYYLRTNYKEATIEEDKILKNHFRAKILPDATSKRKAASKNCVDDEFNDPSIIKNTTHVDFIDKNLDNVHYFKIKSFPTLEEQITSKIYAHQAIIISVDESSFLRLDSDAKKN